MACGGAALADPTVKRLAEDQWPGLVLALAPAVLGLFGLIDRPRGGFLAKLV